MLIAAYQNRSSLRSNSRIDYHQMNRARRKIVVSRTDRQRPVQNIERRNVMIDVYQRGIGQNAQNHTLQHAHQMVVRAVVSRQGNDRIGSQGWDLPTPLCEPSSD
jgi:hypothetical protein